MAHLQYASFNNLIDLASADLGGEVCFVSDDYFASKDNLNLLGRGEWDPDLFYERGKVYDGWESRRNRNPEINDWVVIKLAQRGTIKVVDIDTNHFLGNAPQFASLEGIDVSNLEEDDIDSVEWQPILQSSSLRPGSQNLFLVDEFKEVTYVRLQIYPDGGVARLRLYGEVTKQHSEMERDYASILYNGKAILASDMFFGEMNNLLKPQPPENMGDGWETKRRRGEGNDWVIIKLGDAVIPKRIVIDTMHFKGNFPDWCSIEVCNEPELPDHKIANHANWSTVIDNYKLHADKKHEITNEELGIKDVITHIRLNIFPDGGVARFRVYA